MKTLIFVVLTLLLSCASIAAFGQERYATIDDAGHVRIPTDESVAETYYINVDLTGFSSEVEAVTYFSSKNTDHVYFRALPSQGKVAVILNRKSQPNWTTSQWNTHLAQEVDLKETNIATKTH